MSTPSSVPDAAPHGNAATVTTAVPTRARMGRFGAGFLIFGTLWAVGLAMVANVLLPQRLTDIGVESPDAWFGTINSVTAIVSLVSNLVFGNLSDRIRTPFGRRTPWIFGGAIVGGVSLAAIGTLTDPVAILLVYCVTMVGLNMMLAPALAVISDRVPLKVRGTMSAFFGAGATIGYPLGAIVGAQFITFALSGYLLAGALMLAGGVITLIIWPRERPAPMSATGGETFLDLLKSFRPPSPSVAPDFYKAFSGRLFMLVAYQMITAYQLYIVQNYVGQSTVDSAATVSTMSVITLVVGLGASLTSGPISDWLGRRKLPVIAASLLFAVGIAMPWIFPTAMGMYLYAAIAGLGYGVYNSVDQALNVDVLPDPDRAGKDLGILNLATTLGQTFGPIITSSLVVLTGGYQLVFPVAIVMALLGAVSIVWIKSVK